MSETPIESATDLFVQRGVLLNSLGPGARLFIGVEMGDDEFRVRGDTLDEPLRSLIRAEISKIDVALGKVMPKQS